MAGSIREGIRLYRAKRWELCLAELLQAEPAGSDPEDNADTWGFAIQNSFVTTMHSSTSNRS